MTDNQIEKNEKKVGPIGERLLKLIQFYHLNMNSFSIKLGLPSNSIITRIVKDPERGMSLDLIQKILFEFRDVNPDWFIMGRGDMLIKKGDSQPAATTDLSNFLIQKDETIRAMAETISAKNDLIANLEGRDPLQKHASSG